MDLLRNLGGERTVRRLSRETHNLFFLGQSKTRKVIRNYKLYDSSIHKERQEKSKSRKIKAGKASKHEILPVPARSCLHSVSFAHGLHDSPAISCLVSLGQEPPGGGGKAS